MTASAVGTAIHSLCDTIQEPMRPLNGDCEAGLADVGRFNSIIQLIDIEIDSGTNATYCDVDDRLCRK